MHLYPRAISASAGKHPLRHAAIAAYEMKSVAPVRIRERRPHLRKSGAHSLSTLEARPADFRSSGRLEHTDISHERHERVDVVAVPCVGKCLKPLSRDFDNDLRHEACPAVAPRLLRAA